MKTERKTRDRATFAMVLRGMHFQRDGRHSNPLIYTKQIGDRLIRVALWRDGQHNATHFLQGRMSTYPTVFNNLLTMRRAIHHERYRRDHPPIEHPMPRRRRVVPRPAVQRFAEAMERTLQRHDAAKGSRGWRGAPYSELLELATTQFSDLVATSKRKKPRYGFPAIDLANICMMIFDVGLVEAGHGRIDAMAAGSKKAAK